MSKMVLLILTVTFMLSSPLHSVAANQKIKVYGAASLVNVLEELGRAFGENLILINTDASSKLAKQIEAGAPADVFFSADSEWMDYLEAKNKIVPSSRVNLLSNKIVLIVPAKAKKFPSAPQDLLSDHYHHLALAAESVPAGKFARKALKAEGVDPEKLKKRIVSADNVRVALSWVAVSEADAGVVYATDILLEPRVKVVYIFKPESYPKIIYPAAIIKNSQNVNEAKRFIEFCQSLKAKEIFLKAGFIVL